MDPPDIIIAEGRGKRHKPLSSPSAGINHAKVDRPATDSGYVAEDGPRTAYRFTALSVW